MNPKRPASYPLEIENVGEDTYHFLSKGHHDFSDFMTEVKKRFSRWPMGHPYHAYVVRAPRKGYSAFYYPCESTHPYAIPVTCTDEAYGDEQYTPPKGGADNE
jgi:hypothetical protein